MSKLEWWNTGILEEWVLGKCNVGVMAKSTSRQYLKSIISFGNPLFHRSTIPLFHDLGNNECLKKHVGF
jgi:hypothetical protein